MTTIKNFSVYVDTIVRITNDNIPVFNQGDINTAVLDIYITQNNVPYDLTGASISVSFQKADETIVYQDMTNGVSVMNAVGGQIEVSLNTQTLAYPGSVIGAVAITSGSSTTETRRFTFTVRPSMTSDNALKSNNELSPLLGSATLTTTAKDIKGAINELNADLTTTNASVATNTTNIATHATQIALKANQSDLNTTNANVSTNATAIATKADKTYVDTQNALKADKSYADSINSQVQTNAASLADMAQARILLGKSNGTDDTTAIQNALNTGLPVQFRKSETYIYKNVLTMQPNQVIYGNGAVLKRGNNIVCHGIHMASNCRINDLVMDGNKLNQTLPTWQTYQEILTTDYAVIQNVYIHDSPSEGIMVSGNHIKINSCFVIDSGGNGIHFSGSSDVVVDKCTVINANLTPGTGHEDGCIIWSNSCQNTIVTNCWMENGISGIGSIDSVDDSDVTVTNCVIKNCRTYAIDMVCPSTNPSNVIFKNNRIYNSKLVSINETSGSAATTTIPNKIIFEGNYVEATYFNLNHAKDVKIHNNIFDVAGATISQVIFIGDSFDVDVQGNTIIGGDYGVYVGDGLSVTANVQVNNNKFKNQRLFGIRLQCTNRPNINAVNNDISNDTNSDTTYNAMLVNIGCTAEANKINIAKGQYGVQAGGNNVYILRNTIRTPVGCPSIKTFGGTSGIIMKDNLMTQALANSGGATNTDTGNLIITV